MSKRKFNIASAKDIAAALRGEDEGTKLEMVPYSDIVTNPNQPRKSIGDLHDLTASIEERGIIEPLIVRQKGVFYELVAGERRYKAAGYTKRYTESGEMLPCVVMDVTDEEAFETSLWENINREDLNPIEFTQGVLKLIDLKMKGVEGYRGAVETLNAMYNKERGRSTLNILGTEIVSEIFKILPIKWESFLLTYVPLLSMPDDVKEALMKSKEFKPAHARQIAKIGDRKIREQLIHQVVENGMGLRELKRIVNIYQKKLGEPSKTTEPKRNKFLTFEELPNLKIRSRKNRFILDIDLKSGDLLETLTHLVDLIKQGKIANLSDA